MHSNWFDFPSDIYAKHLNRINGVKFTRREIDIVAFIVSGRSAKKTATFLNLSPRTVENYTHNIMVKLECNSKESIIDFIEKSGKFSFVKEYYSNLLTNEVFENYLKKISVLKGSIDSKCLIVHWQTEHKNASNSLAHHLEFHLKLAGIETTVQQREYPQTFAQLSEEPNEYNYVIYAVPKMLLEQFQTEIVGTNMDTQQTTPIKLSFPSNKLLFLSEPESASENPNHLISIDYIGIAKQGDYYHIVFEVLKKLVPNPGLERHISDFKEKNFELYQVPFSDSETRLHENRLPNSKLSANINRSLIKRNRVVTMALLFLGLGGLGFVGSNYLEFVQKIRGKTGSSQHQIKKETLHVRSNLVIPTEAILLYRTQLLREIEDKLKNQEGIQVVALIGPGGAGKTTLARQYARHHKSAIVWEVIAESRGSIAHSFENLVHALCKTDEERRLLNTLQHIRDSKEREEKIVHLAASLLRVQPDWILIYDNLENFGEMLNYFPFDPTVWGHGKVIITTQDSHIQHNDYVNHILQIDELNSKEKLELFEKIMNHGSAPPSMLYQSGDIQNFLTEIPSFPLDISLAAHYIKTTNVDYNQYLEKLINHSVDFERVQKHILEESSNYTKTRYNIATLSIRKLIDTNKNFEALLLLISLVGSQNIPIALLSSYKKEIDIDDFVFHLRKYSLITNGFYSRSNPSISIHRSTQKICLRYMEKISNLEKTKSLIHTIAYFFENYVNDTIDQESCINTSYLVAHCKKFVSHENLLTIDTKTALNCALGSIYFNLGNYTKSKKILEENISGLEGNIKSAHYLELLGNANREVGNYQEAVNILEKSRLITEKNLAHNHEKLAKVLTSLGNAYRNLGDVQKSKLLLEDSLGIYRKHYPEKYGGLGRSLGYLGNIHWIMGDYTKAKNLLEESLQIYKKHCPENKFAYARILMYLGKTYCRLGESKKCKQYIEEGLKIYVNHFDKNHTDVAWASLHLGMAYTELGDYKKAEDILEETLSTYKKNYPSEHIDIAWVSVYLGGVYSALGKYQNAITLLEQSRIIYEKTFGTNHTDTAWVLVNLGQAYMNGGQLETAERYINHAVEVFQKNNHPELYKSLEALAEVYLRKAANQKNKHQSRQHKEQATASLKKALEILKIHFPHNSPHIRRISAKLNDL